MYGTWPQSQKKFELTCRFSNFLASTYNQSTMRVFNFAIAGSVVERHAYEPRLQGIAPSPDSVTFKEQVDNAFRRNYVRKPEWVRWQGYAPEQNVQTWNGSTTLFATWFGVNDILQAVVKGKQIPIDAIFASYSASFERVHILYLCFESLLSTNKFACSSTALAHATSSSSMSHQSTGSLGTKPAG